MRTAFLRAFPVLAVVTSLGAVACSGAAAEETDDVDDAALSAEDKDYTFRAQLPPNSLFREPLTKSFPFEVSRGGVTLKATITPTVQLSVGSPVFEGSVSVGKRRALSAILGAPVPKILDGEVKVTSTYRADLKVGVDFAWSGPTSRQLTVDLMRDLNEKVLARRALELLTGVDAGRIPLLGADGEKRDDLPLGLSYDVIVTCNFDELDGAVKGELHTGFEGSVVARGLYNPDGVEKRRFRKDPTQKFEVDTSDFRIEPTPTFRFDGITQHIKGTCSVQPVAIVKFADKAGVRLRVDGRTAFDVTAEPDADMTPLWRMRAKPELNLWGEVDITVPIIHTTIDKKSLLWTKSFPEWTHNVEGG